MPLYPPHINGRGRTQSGIVQLESYQFVTMTKADLSPGRCFLFNFHLLFGSLSSTFVFLLVQSFTPSFSNYHWSRVCSRILQQDDSSVYMICGLMFFYLDLQFGLRDGTPP